MPVPALLSLDRGNSTLDGCLWSPTGAVLLRQRFLAHHPEVGADVRSWLADCLAAMCGGSMTAVGATVVPQGLGSVARALEELGVVWRAVPEDLAVPLAVDYHPPASLGVDRRLAACGAVALVGAPVIIVDCGTATTVGAVRPSGVFAGGAIAPGLDGLRAGMGQRTPHLPAVAREQLVSLPARTSAGAVAGGAILGFCGMVERLVGDVLASGELGPGPVPIVVTGGHGSVLAAHGARLVRVVEDLVHRGLRATWLAAQS